MHAHLEFVHFYLFMVSNRFGFLNATDPKSDFFFFFFFDGKPQITLSLLRIKNPHRIHPTGLGQQLQEGCLPPISDTPENI